MARRERERAAREEREKRAPEKRRRPSRRGVPPPAPPPSSWDTVISSLVGALPGAGREATSHLVATALGALLLLMAVWRPWRRGARAALDPPADLSDDEEEKLIGTPRRRGRRRSDGMGAAPPRAGRGPGYTVACLTWNVGAHDVSFASATRWLAAASDAPADVYAIGLQEAVQLSAANTLDPRRGGVGKKAARAASRMAALLKGAADALHREEYLLVDEPVCLVGVCLVVLVRRATRVQPALVFGASVPCGFAGLGNKGCCALRMSLGTSTLCVVNVHLPAGTSAAASAARDEAFAELLTALGARLHRAGAQLPLEHDLCVVLGDFNSRVGLEREKVER
jgi:hypothetical protein